MAEPADKPTLQFGGRGRTAAGGAGEQVLLGLLLFHHPGPALESHFRVGGGLFRIGAATGSRALLILGCQAGGGIKLAGQLRIRVGGGLAGSLVPGTRAEADIAEGRL